MYGISLDLRTSGITGHAVELPSGKILSTAMTECHPLPGANAMDHLMFSMRSGKSLAHSILMKAVNRLIRELDINLGRVDSVGICGNPIQMSIFQDMYVDDLAYTGEKARRMRGITKQDRNARSMSATDVGLELPERATVYIPPAVKHDIGADTLASFLKSGFMEQKGNCMLTDYGTTSEMALKVEDDIFTGSAAAGPYIEGQYIRSGMLPSPGAISDLDYEFQWRCKVIDKDMIPESGDLIDIGTKTLVAEGPMHRGARGITGAGMIGVLNAMYHMNYRRKGRLYMPKGRIDLQDGLFVQFEDMMEVCKSIGAIRAGHFSLIQHASMGFDDLNIMYMTGSAGFYTDAVKARALGLVPPCCDEIYQTGNAPLEVATDLVHDPELLDRIQDIANDISSKHVDFSVDDVFEYIYVQELAFWTEGMSMDMYNENLEMAEIQRMPKPKGIPNVHRRSERSIPEIGEKGFVVVRDIGSELVGRFEHCTGCKVCQKECPESVLRIGADKVVHIRTRNCLGTSCFKCQYKCPMKVFRFEDLKLQA